MKENLEKIKLLVRDLRNGKEFPHSPRETLGGYVLAACTVDKCRAVGGVYRVLVPSCADTVKRAGGGANQVRVHFPEE